MPYRAVTGEDIGYAMALRDHTQHSWTQISRLLPSKSNPSPSTLLRALRSYAARGSGRAAPGAAGRRAAGKRRAKFEAHIRILEKLLAEENAAGNRLFRCPRELSREAAQRNTPIGSRSTVRRLLFRAGRVPFRQPRGAAKRPGDLGVRLRFCRAELRLRANVRNCTVFTDEKIFDTNDHGRGYFWGKKGEKAPRRERTKFAPSVHVWGMIGVGIKLLIFHKVRDTRKPEGERAKRGRPRKGEAPRAKAKRAPGINARTHIETCLVPAVALLNSNAPPGGGRWRLMQDGASCHTAKETVAWLADQGVDSLVGWPSRSPDLNPIEALWSTMQERVSHSGPRDQEELKAVIRRLWEEIPQAEIDGRVLAYSRWLREVVGENGQQRGS